jgi:hypothetical protein
MWTMGINRFKPHRYVLPEDRRNVQILNGFIKNPAINIRAIQVLPEAGGWCRVKEEFTDDLVPKLYAYPLMNVLLTIDFDNCFPERFENVQDSVPGGLKDRVFVLGVLSEPERLKRSIGMSFERIGEALSRDCLDNTRTVWGHELLRHNVSELERLIPAVRKFLCN